jgi:hypothetical protein
MPAPEEVITHALRVQRLAKRLCSTGDQRERLRLYKAIVNAVEEAHYYDKESRDGRS